MPDCAIIGAGPAGCVAAIALARRLWDVTLIEQHRYPHDKVCGECLGPVGLDVLSRLGLLPLLRSLGPADLSSVRIHIPIANCKSKIANASLPFPVPSLGISRSTLDALLLDAARESGAKVLQPCRCEEISHAPVRLVLRDLASNLCRTLAPRFVLLADGKGALLGQRPPFTGDMGIKIHLAGADAPRDAIELFALPGHYCGLGAIERDRWDLAMAVPGARLRAFNGNLDALLADCMNFNSALAARLRGATRAGGWLAAPLPRFGVVDDWPPDVIPLGNAAAALEPIAGEGIALAMRSAELAAIALDDAVRLHRPFSPTALRSSFNRLWRIRRGASRLAGRLLSCPAAAENALEVLQASPALADLSLRLLGKSAPPS